MTKTEPKKELKVVKKITPPAEVSAGDQKEIKVIERIIESREVSADDTFGKLNRSQIELIKNTVAKGATDDELKMFLQVCKGANLNPFLKQVFLVPRWDTRAGKETRAIQVSIDGFRAIAEESGNYAGNEDPEFELDENKKPVSAKVTVYKIVQGTRCPFTATARWSEYFPGEKMGFMWKTKPHIMLGKCAEALALRKAFPKLLSGMYSHEEMDQAQNQDPKEEKKQKAAKGLQTVLKLIKKCKKGEIEDFIKKMSNSPLYSDKQKTEFMTAAANQIDVLEKIDEEKKKGKK